MTYAEADLDREIVKRGGLYEYVQLAWPHVEPSPFVPNWHLEEVCLHLEAVTDRRIKRLIINIPPGSTKSLLCNVFWPSWEWLTKPKSKWFHASFDGQLIGRDADKSIKLLGSDWHLERWEKILARNKPAKMLFETTSGGFRFGTSIGGKGTGRHADTMVVDDPIKPKDTEGGHQVTKKALRVASDWFSSTAAMRRSDPESFAQVVTMQRLHHEDPSGELLKTGRYQHLCLRMQYDPDHPCVTSIGGDRRTKKDELLFPARFPQDVVDELKNVTMGEDNYAAQCQQDPNRKGGTVFQRQWWRFWHYKTDVLEPCLCAVCWTAKHDCFGHKGKQLCVQLPGNGLDIQSWDCTFKGKERSDFVSGGMFRTVARKTYLVDRVNARMTFTKTITEILSMTKKWPSALDKLIESAANGSAVCDSLGSELPGITPVDPLGGKEARAHASTPMHAGGRFFIPHPDLAPWVFDYVNQHENFPNTANDDDVDMTSQALNKLRVHGDDFSRAMQALRGR